MAIRLSRKCSGQRTLPARYLECTGTTLRAAQAPFRDSDGSGIARANSIFGPFRDRDRSEMEDNFDPHRNNRRSRFRDWFAVRQDGVTRPETGEIPAVRSDHWQCGSRRALPTSYGTLLGSRLSSLYDNGHDDALKHLARMLVKTSATRLGQPSEKGTCGIARSARRAGRDEER